LAASATADPFRGILGGHGQQSPHGFDSLQFDDPDQHPVHQRHHRRSPKGATLTHHNILNNGYFIGEAMRLTEATGSASRCRSITASAW
jgi:hypothetical protein